MMQESNFGMRMSLKAWSVAGSSVAPINIHFFFITTGDWMHVVNRQETQGKVLFLLLLLPRQITLLTRVLHYRPLFPESQAMMR